MPPFYVKAKEVNFPLIGNMASLNLVNEEKDKRDLVYEENGQIVSGSENESNPAMTGQFGGEGI